MRVRIGVACVVAALVVVAGVVLWPKGGKAATHVEVAATTTTTAPTTTATTEPPHPFEAADAVVPEVQLYDAPGATAPIGLDDEPDARARAPRVPREGAGSSGLGAGADPAPAE